MTLQQLATSVGVTISPSLKFGSGGSCLDGGWGQVPLGCSAQRHNGGSSVWNLHFKTSGDTGKGCIHQDFQLVCSGPAPGKFLVRVHLISLIYVLTSSHPRVLTSLRPHHVFTSSRLHAFTSSRLHVFTSSPLPHALTTSRLHVFTSSRPRVYFLHCIVV